MLEHFVFFLEFLLAEKLSVMFAFQFLDGSSEFEDFLFLLGDGLEVVRLTDEYFIRVVDDLPQFNVFCFELSNL